MATLQEALAHFNTDIPQWYKWKDTKNGEVYSNLELRVEEAVMPTEEEVNAKIAEITVPEYKIAREREYPNILEFVEAYTEKEILGDSTKWDAYVVKYNQVRTDNPKP